MPKQQQTHALEVYRRPVNNGKKNATVDPSNPQAVKCFEIWLPMGKKRGDSYKAAGGNEPGKVFKDPQGKFHRVPKKQKNKKTATERKR